MWKQKAANQLSVSQNNHCEFFPNTPFFDWMMFSPFCFSWFWGRMGLVCLPASLNWMINWCVPKAWIPSRWLIGPIAGRSRREQIDFWESSGPWKNSNYGSRWKIVVRAEKNIKIVSFACMPSLEWAMGLTLFCVWASNNIYHIAKNMEKMNVAQAPKHKIKPKLNKKSWNECSSTCFQPLWYEKCWNY